MIWLLLGLAFIGGVLWLAWWLNLEATGMVTPPSEDDEIDGFFTSPKARGDP